MHECRDPGWEILLMSIQKIIAAILLILGILYGAALLMRAMRDRGTFRQEKGSFPALCFWETVIYFCATVGISDFLLNTLLLSRLKITEDKNLPGTLVCACLLPGAIIAFFLLRVENPVHLSTLIPCCIAITAGSSAGAKFVTGLDGSKVRRFMTIALICSLAALLVRIGLTRGVSGTAADLSGVRLVLAILLSFAAGVVNMMGVPMKPANTAIFLLLGLSPLSTLTMVLVMACIGPMGGGLPVIKSGAYHQKLVCAAVIFGSAGAVIGSMVAISLSAGLLNALLILVMIIAIISMIRK